MILDLPQNNTEGWGDGAEGGEMGQINQYTSRWGMVLVMDMWRLISLLCLFVYVWNSPQ